MSWLWYRNMVPLSLAPQNQSAKSLLISPWWGQHFTCALPHSGSLHSSFKTQRYLLWKQDRQNILRPPRNHPIPGDPTQGSTGVETTGTLVRHRSSVRASANSQESTTRDVGQTRTRARTKAPKLALADTGERAASSASAWQAGPVAPAVAAAPGGGAIAAAAGNRMPTSRTHLSCSRNRFLGSPASLRPDQD